jgi:hypothetical protein
VRSETPLKRDLARLKAKAAGIFALRLSRGRKFKRQDNVPSPVTEAKDASRSL